MQFILAETNQPEDIQITTVTLAPDLSEPDKLKIYAFHCPRCGLTVTRHSGFILSIFPGLEPAVTPVLTRCRKCGAIYYFKSIVSK